LLPLRVGARTPALEHLEHAIGDHPATHDIQGAEKYRGDGNDVAEGVVRGGGDGERSHQHDAVDEVGSRHQWRVQHRRHSGDQQEADEDGQRENESAKGQRLRVAQEPAPASNAVICSPIGLPSWVMHVWLITTSSKSSLTAPSLMICVRNRVTLCEYNWLACPGSAAGRLVGPSTRTPCSRTSSSARVYSQLPPA